MKLENIIEFKLSKGGEEVGGVFLGRNKDKWLLLNDEN